MKLAIGQTLAAWKAYPTTRSRLAAVEHQRPLLVSGAYRSGTSWLGDMLTTPNTWHLHEPLSPRAGFLKCNFQYRRSTERDPALDGFLEGLLRGRITNCNGVPLLQGIHSNRKLMPARLGMYRGVPRRVLIKDPLACLMTEYLVRNQGFEALLVIRHPAGFVSSLDRLGWDTARELRQLLRDEDLMSDWLAPYEQMLRRGAKRPGVTAHASLYAAIWIVLQRFVLRNPEVSVVAYEQLCKNPEAEMRALHDRYGLRAAGDDHCAKVWHRDKGQSAVSVESPFSLVRDSKIMPSIWRERLDERSIEVTRTIWRAASLPYYQVDSEWLS